MWNLDKIHKVGELIAAVAVVMSLIFVGIEVRQNNQVQIQLATRSLMRDWSNAVSALQDPELACLNQRMYTDNANLTMQESTQIETVYWRIFRTHEEFHYQYEQGMIDESVWGGVRNAALWSASNQGFRDWWVAYKPFFSRRYREFMDELIATTPVDSNYFFLGLACDTPVGNEYWKEEFDVEE